ncbi:MAG: hypothetical protein R3Y63_13450 [Eubacteriales bacterium]
MNLYYDNSKESIWSRLEENSDIDELIYGFGSSHESERTEDASER